MKDPRETTRLPRAAGILAVVASLIALTESIFFFWGVEQTWVFTHASYYGWRVLDVSFFYYLAIGVFALFSFFIGLASAAFILERKRIKLSMCGLSMLMVCGVMIFLWVFIAGSLALSDILFISLFSLPILVPSGLSVIFVYISKAQFS